MEERISIPLKDYERYKNLVSLSVVLGIFLAWASLSAVFSYCELSVLKNNPVPRRDQIIIAKKLLSEYLNGDIYYKDKVLEKFNNYPASVREAAAKELDENNSTKR